MPVASSRQEGATAHGQHSDCTSTARRDVDTARSSCTAWTGRNSRPGSVSSNRSSASKIVVLAANRSMEPAEHGEPEPEPGALSLSHAQLAEEMACAIHREPGAAGRYDVARRLFRERERELLERIARGSSSSAAFAELEALRKSPLGFGPSATMPLQD